MNEFLFWRSAMTFPLGCEMTGLLRKFLIDEQIREDSRNRQCLWTFPFDIASFGEFWQGNADVALRKSEGRQLNAIGFEVIPSRCGIARVYSCLLPADISTSSNKIIFRHPVISQPAANRECKRAIFIFIDRKRRVSICELWINQHLRKYDVAENSNTINETRCGLRSNLASSFLYGTHKN